MNALQANNLRRISTLSNRIEILSDQVSEAGNEETKNRLTNDIKNLSREIDLNVKHSFENN